ncbi:acetyltransferase [Brochothrix thermosphacta]|uniref:acetyltransferase n=1 Tax=Brochothrix thermosphacta TaxID=2756 RepID=UPI00083F8663|nr:acetyltransferase [Brochothrix thermosphacta]ANZ94777.1 hypothetical protein BFC19_04865 [Brochothrix thermosphacta]ANZ96914.1 hypothetical protein BFC20_03875 [Brochothrix thermosphacta]MDO7864327.1 acetyltransferase [Brochothrix thermosphacta]ODJ70536.1 hypothetical protein BFR43_06065 [Brochothrix thermosphacta]HCZ38745.1 acetyltransferase [Brochothrix thermosphacta]
MHNINDEILINNPQTNFIVLIGGGDMSEYASEIIKQDITKHTLFGICDDSYDSIKKKNNIWYGSIDNIVNWLKDYPNVYFCFTIGSPNARYQISNRIGLAQEKYATLVHKTAIVEESAQLGYGVIVGARSLIGASTIIQNHAMILTAIVEHHSNIGAYSNISPSATLCGGVVVGKLSYVGANTTVVPYKKIGNNVIVGAHSLVISDITDNIKCFGMPVKINKEV